LKSGPERTWIVRQADAIPQYQVGHRALLGGVAKRLDALPGIHLTGNGYRGVSVANLVEDAEKTAERVLRSA
jgi:oxygen-dependent protoporphyrinogen oxidase